MTESKKKIHPPPMLSFQVSDKSLIHHEGSFLSDRCSAGKDSGVEAAKKKSNVHFPVLRNSMLPELRGRDGTSTKTHIHTNWRNKSAESMFHSFQNRFLWLFLRQTQQRRRYRSGERQKSSVHLSSRTTTAWIQQHYRTAHAHKAHILTHPCSSLQTEMTHFDFA